MTRFLIFSLRVNCRKPHAACHLGGPIAGSAPAGDMRARACARLTAHGRKMDRIYATGGASQNNDITQVCCRPPPPSALVHFFPFLCSARLRRRWDPAGDRRRLRLRRLHDGLAGWRAARRGLPRAACGQVGRGWRLRPVWRGPSPTQRGCSASRHILILRTASPMYRIRV